MNLPPSVGKWQTHKGFWPISVLLSVVFAPKVLPINRSGKIFHCDLSSSNIAKPQSWPPLIKIGTASFCLVCPVLHEPMIWSSYPLATLEWTSPHIYTLSTPTLHKCNTTQYSHILILYQYNLCSLYNSLISTYMPGGRAGYVTPCWGILGMPRISSWAGQPGWGSGG